MQKIIIFSVFLATSLAAPGYYYTDVDYHVPVKSTFTTSSQSVDHGSTHVLHASVPLGKTTFSKSSQAVDHGSIHVLDSVPVAKTTVTKSNQVVNHGGTTVVYAPVLSTYHAPIVSYHAPLVSTYHAPVSGYTGDSAVSHHSSTVHETVPVINHLPLYTLH